MNQAPGRDQLRSEYRFTCALKTGLHARPASMLAEAVRGFSARITLAKLAGSETVDLRSVLSVVGLDVKIGDACVVTATGDDAGEALRALRDFVEHRLAEGDELPPLEPTAPGAVTARLPVSLRRLEVAHSPGRSVCAGVGVGCAVVVAKLSLPKEARVARSRGIDIELEAADRAVGAVRDELRRRSSQARARLENELLAAHADIASDPALWAEIDSRVREGATAAQAVAAAADRFADHLRSAASQYIRDRAVDVQDVCMQILDRLTDGKVGATRISLQKESVVFAETLTANQLLHLKRSLVKGLVLGHVGATSHTVIIARSLRIPTLIDVPNADTLLRGGETVVVDGEGGFVITAVTPAVVRHYERERRTEDRWRKRMEPLAARPVTTTDGARLEVGSNGSSADQIEAAVANGADGIGLFRTEVLFLERSEPPSEEEQFSAYSAAVRAAGGRPVIIRTFDIGGDKAAPYLQLAPEDNPFLGVRGLRLYDQHKDLFRTQLRAIIRASALGPVKIMAPMVTTPTEAAWFRSQVRDVQSALKAAAVPFDPDMPIGIMIEVPAAALVIDQLCDEVDFFSVGTNDLCQYSMAADRGNAALAALASPRQPSFLRLLRHAADGARAKGRWIGVCGEMAGNRDNIPLMLGLRLNEISIAPGDVPTIKSIARTADAAACRRVLDAACTCRSASEVELLIRETHEWTRLPDEKILDDELVMVDSDAASKEEAIKEAIDLLFIAGRTQRPRDIEEAIWAREATYSTGLGYAFAIPHCKTDAIRAPALVALRLAAPVEWGSSDGQPVRVVLLLAVPASDTTGAHMKVFARLARKLMHEDFRETILDAPACADILKCLRDTLGID